MTLKKKRIPWNKGMKMTPEQKSRMNLSGLEKGYGWWTGKSIPEEMRLKISLTKKGTSAWNKGKKGTGGMTGKKHSPQAIAKIKEAQKFNYLNRPRGENHYKWIENRNELAKYKNGNEYRNSPAHREWSRSVKKRDGWKCKIANSECSDILESHHILGWKEYPELRYQINNGITLCRFHHPRKKEDEVKLSPYFQSLVTNKRN